MRERALTRQTRKLTTSKGVATMEKRELSAKEAAQRKPLKGGQNPSININNLEKIIIPNETERESNKRRSQLLRRKNSQRD